MTAPLSRPSSIDSIAGGKLTDRKTWITVLKVAAWLLTILGFIYGIISCVALSSDSYFNEGDVGAGILSMLTIWVGCFIGTAALLVLANAAEDLAAIRRQGETRR
jgi:hypothetical protein